MIPSRNVLWFLVAAQVVTAGAGVSLEWSGFGGSLYGTVAGALFVFVFFLSLYVFGRDVTLTRAGTASFQPTILLVTVFFCFGQALYLLRLREGE